MAQDMTNERFRALWKLLGDYMSIRSEGSQSSLSGLSGSGVMTIINTLKGEMDAFSDEYVARRKAEFESAANAHDDLKQAVGAERFDGIQAEYRYGCNFNERG